VGAGTHSILMVIVRIYPTSGTAIEVQFLSLFVTVSFLKVRVRAHARKEASIRGPLPVRRRSPDQVAVGRSRLYLKKF
jgi:hypothetical protein